jgi:hypothetical protein
MDLVTSAHMLVSPVLLQAMKYLPRDDPCGLARIYHKGVTRCFGLSRPGNPNIAQQVGRGSPVALM